MCADATSAERRDESPAAHGGRAPKTQLAEQERQFREMLEFCPAALVIVDEDGRLLFHNARLRELLVNQIPLSAIGYNFPIERFRELITTLPPT